ncbi:hypothetical protein P4284_07735 [Bacillus swezeyi]|uniref:hypothetical protein n=1 Tax=Bacillus swezeyi TaxID=1925020 RepID=UPI002E1F2B2C|nr:hypothetical protein [Bacillus swezeyi]
MNWFEFISSLFNSWPLAIVVVVLLLKNPIGSLINRIGDLKSIKYKDILDLNFGDQVSKLRKIMKHTEEEEAVEPDGEQNFFLGHIMRIAERSPQEAVYVSWIELEKQLRYMLVRINAPTHKSTVQDIVEYLVEENYIDPQTGHVIFSLHNLRDAVARDYPEAQNISRKDAIEYYKVVEELIARFQGISSDYYEYTPST